jgi:hypothetical protein
MIKRVDLESEVRREHPRLAGVALRSRSVPRTIDIQVIQPHDAAPKPLLPERLRQNRSEKLW